ncbi:DUF1353 domain-containing protein [Bradyrhizobium sp. 146]|uniref:DUF1353 domain-containing protein n=1 Tax=Bradyrhizobium sp. 146 TaxID=2782622 RepID=UPI001FFA67F2|nr:DUF1353 domain-containing protein [Bradyrhizobium sp. 146]MCK1699875.1 DUF1353 domain-containing protein [Bradyrhizobium sp. 146]
MEPSRFSEFRSMFTYPDDAVASSLTRRRLLTSALAVAGTMGVGSIGRAEPVDHFVGEALLRDLDPEGLRFTLDQPFGYVDPSGIMWQAEKGLVTDGASIPWPLWSIVGGPFEGQYRRAAVIHDFYCDRKYRTWQRTHRVFYDAMITGGVSTAKAKLMYYAVWRFGPRWSVTEIVPCAPEPSIGKFCASVKPTSVELSVERPIVEEKDVAGATRELNEVADKVSKDDVSLDQIEKLADSKPPVPRARSITRKAVILSSAPVSRYEDFGLSETTTVVPDHMPIPGLFPGLVR